MKEAITNGEMVAKKSINRLLEEQMNQLKSKNGIIIDGYPRDIHQIEEFETKVIRCTQYQNYVLLHIINNLYICSTNKNHQ